MLRDAWDANAEAWIGWARSPELDHEFWCLNLPSLLDLLPPPGGLTIDVGCGEGRVARRLKELGYRVVGIESSSALAAAAREADSEFEIHVADAAEMPLADGVADLAIASMVLMNVDDPQGVVREVARVLEPGGRFCLTVLHPLNSLAEAGSDASYFVPSRYAKTLERGGTAMTFHDSHRPLRDYLRWLEEAGFMVERLREPTPDADYVTEHPAAAQWLHKPAFLQLRAAKRA